MVVVDPSFGPVDPWLGGHEPWIAEDHFLWAQFREEEPHSSPLFSSPDFKVRKEFDPSVLVGGSIYVIDLSGGLESFEGDS